MTMPRAALAAALLLPCLLPTASPAAATDRPTALIERWQSTNSNCRGLSGDDPRSIKACAEREAISRRLGADGWCYGRRGEYGYQMEWHRCGRRSTRPGG